MASMSREEIYDIACNAVERTHGKRITNLEADVVCLLAHSIRITCREMILFMLGIQTKQVRHRSHFENGNYAWILGRVSSETGRSSQVIKFLVDGLTLGRNQSAHCDRAEELSVKIGDCLDMFRLHLTMVHFLEDEYYVLQNANAFRYEVAPVPAVQPAKASTKNHKGKQRRNEQTGGDTVVAKPLGLTHAPRKRVKRKR